jgi:hypothetical protein
MPVDYYCSRKNASIIWQGLAVNGQLVSSAYTRDLCLYLYNNARKKIIPSIFWVSLAHRIKKLSHNEIVLSEKIVSALWRKTSQTESDVCLEKGNKQEPVNWVLQLFDFGIKMTHKIVSKMLHT